MKKKKKKKKARWSSEEMIPDALRNGHMKFPDQC